MWHRIAASIHLGGRDRRGATAIEYALIAAGIALAIIVSVFVLGGDVLGLYQDVGTELSTGG